MQGAFDMKKKLALFLLKSREVHKLPRTVVDSICLELKDLFQFSQALTEGSIRGLFHEHSLEVNIDEAMNHSQQLVEAFDQLNSEFKQLAYFREQFNYVDPIEIMVGDTVKENVLYVPILQTLQHMLSHQDVLAQVLNGHSSQNGKLRDFCDGSLFNSNELFKSEPTALQIQLYYDDFNVVNPLGNKVRTYKIGAFYFTLGNLHPCYRSKLYVMQLLCLCRSEVVKKVGLSAVLQPAINDLAHLESEGLTLYVDGVEHKFGGSVSMVIADNLASHGLAGFIESFNSLRICRFCLGTKEEIQSKFDSDEFQMRTEEMHRHHVESVQLHHTLASTYGVAKESPLNELDYFNVVTGFPPDLAHDLFEGVLPEILTLCLRQFISDGVCTVNEINNAVLKFPYQGSDKCSKPSSMSSELSQFKVKQTASQTWCLLRLLPIMLGDVIPAGNSYFELVLSLVSVVELICAPVQDGSTIALMKSKITDLLHLIRELFPDFTMKPKCHFLVHYPDLTMKYGPLSRCWTLRFEETSAPDQSATNDGLPVHTSRECSMLESSDTSAGPSTSSPSASEPSGSSTSAGPSAAKSTIHETKTIYPTSDMYVAASKSVIQCYPFLQDTNPCSNPYDSWKLALSENFRNERRNMQLPSVLKRKRCAPAGPVRKRPMKNWTTSRPTGEDDVSIGRHKEWLQTEMKKSRNINQEKVDHLMRLTFADRRKMVQNNCPIGDVRKEFPALFQVDQTHAEFSLLMGENLEKQFIRTMKPILEKVVKWPFSKKEDRDMVSKAKDMCKDDPESDAALVAGSFLLPRLLLESPNDLFVEGGTEYSEAAPIPSTPVIVYSGNLFETSSFSIMAENEEICQPLSLYTSLYSLMATFYCFNLEYPPKAKRTLEFLQKVGLSLHDNVKLSPRVASVYAKLKV